MEVIKITPRGYCYGVVDALQAAREAAKNADLPRPLYIIGQIIHNRHAIQELTSLGVITLDGPDRATILEQVTEGTVIFTAHGVSPLVQERARERGLHVIDATCPDVTLTHDLVRALVDKGYYIIYIGKKGHPEPEGVMGEIPGHVSLVETESDVDELQLTPAQEAKLAVSTQTTLSKWDTQRVIQHIKARYPTAEVHVDICPATQNRQEAVAAQAKGADLTVVVGDPRSNNTNRLVQVSEELAGVPAIRIEDLSQLDLALLKDKKRIAVTAGASTPSQLTRQVIQFLEQYTPENAEPQSSLQ
ncbi:MAG TPA: 4-hydroxy-3-methylbut-2-enyl diphosphate reductase [Ktedonobacteraceae bacterium]|jgi:4-hydroxy-3-methylbut-2-enyl diphosphate reductase|nr:4-hydroxy-3-methylbut-2-enyl diphosphate reductase [Ktedonobacteraceae bacterium]